MANSKHSALDGSVVSFTADADLSAPMTAFGFVKPRGWPAPQPFNVFPAGKSERVLASLPDAYPDVSYRMLGETEVNGGVLRMARVRRPVSTGGFRRFIYAVWEGSNSSLTTSVRGQAARMEDLFDKLEFRETDTGIAVDSPVDETVRPLRCLKEVGNTLLEVQPLTPHVSRTLPRDRGRPVANGDLYRRSEASREVLLVTPSAAVFASPLGGADEHVELATDMAVAWGE